MSTSFVLFGYLAALEWTRFVRSQYGDPLDVRSVFYEMRELRLEAKVDRLIERARHGN